MLKIGDTAPDFELKDQDGNLVKLSALQGKFVVLYFYVEDMTSGCTVEACDFRDFNQNIKDANAFVIGIGGGTSETKVQFAKEHNLNFPLLQDDKNVSNTYEVIDPANGKIMRTTYLIDREGKVAWVWEKVDHINHAKAVLDKLNELNA